MPLRRRATPARSIRRGANGRDVPSAPSSDATSADGGVGAGRCQRTTMAAAAAGRLEQIKAAAPSTGSMLRFTSDRKEANPVIPVPMLVDTPSAIHHRGQ